MHDTRKPPRRVDAAAIVEALRAGGSGQAAADILGMKLGTFHTRAARLGVPTRQVLRQLAQERVDDVLGVKAAPATSNGAVQLVEGGQAVQLPLTDYMVLVTMARDRQGEVDRLNRIIVSLTRALEACGRSE